VSFDNATVESTLSPIHSAARQLVAGLERPDVLLTVAGGLGVHGPDDLRAVASVAGPMRHDAGFCAAETTGRTFRIMAFVPGIADQDQLATDVAGRKLGGAAATIVEGIFVLCPNDVSGLSCNLEDADRRAAGLGSAKRARP
jgi:hypothetical protein